MNKVLITKINIDLLKIIGSYNLQSLLFDSSYIKKQSLFLYDLKINTNTILFCLNCDEYNENWYSKNGRIKRMKMYIEHICNYYYWTIIDVKKFNDTQN